MKKSKGSYNRSEKIIKINEDFLWGIHPVFEGLEQEPKRFIEIIIQKERRNTKIEDIVQMSRQHGVKVSFVDAIRLTGEGASRVRHQGVIARTCETPLVPFAELMARMKVRIGNGERTCLVVCDSLQDPHNIGAIARSALASGGAGLIVTRERSAPVGGTAAKASAGAMSHIDICQVTNLVNSLKELKKIGFWVFGTVKDDDAQSLYETDLTVPACLVVGSEGKGLRPLVKKECDVLISIPMQGKIDSLNSSVAAAVTLFEAMRQSLATS